MLGSSAYRVLDFCVGKYDFSPIAQVRLRRVNQLQQLDIFLDSTVIGAAFVREAVDLRQDHAQPIIADAEGRLQHVLAPAESREMVWVQYFQRNQV